MNRNRIAATTTLAAALAVTLLGCTGTPASTSPASTSPASTSPASTSTSPASPATTAAPRPVTMAGARNCPVTIGHPVPSSKPWREGLFGWQHAYGNGSLWVGALWPHGVVIITPDNVDPNGRLGMKFGWYRLTSGFLAITGRRLDAQAPPASGVASGYGLIGFNASGVIFPTEGCWQVTGRVARVTLTFVTFVIKGHCDTNAVCVPDRAR
jgi:hypothetical protein